MLKRYLHALGAMALLVASAGCEPDCKSTDECVARMGEGHVCNLRRACVPAPQCSPGCSGATPVCDPETVSCKTCTATAGCMGETPICDTRANQGAGQCITCTAAEGCGPGRVCDTSVAGGRCVQTPAPSSQQIAAIRGSPDLTPLALPLDGALVTYKKAPFGSADVAGFFLQGEQSGPALFVAVDPATLTPSPQVGDRVSLTVTEVNTVSGIKQVAALTGFAVLSSGHPIAGLAQDLTTATDLISGLSNYESEMIRIGNITLANAFGFAGTGHSSAQITTPGMAAADSRLRLRIPDALKASLELVQGCVVRLDHGPMWRLNDQAQPSAYGSELSVVSCPAPAVVSAVASATNEVKVTFSRRINPSSVLANGSQFTFDNGLAAAAAAVSGNVVTVTTGSQAGGASYTVTVASSVTDTHGAGVGSPNTATFLGYQVGAVLLINEVQPSMVNSTDLIELRVVQGGTTNGMVLQQDLGAPVILATLPNVEVAAGDLIVIHQRPAATAAPDNAAPTHETTAKDAHPSATYGANYDSAWDFLGNDVGVTFSNRLLVLKDVAGAIQDAVALARIGTSTPAFPGEVQRLISEGQWSPACPGSCSLADAQSISADWTALKSSSADKTSDTVRRAGPDTHSKGDWSVGGQSFGLPNP